MVGGVRRERTWSEDFMMGQSGVSGFGGDGEGEVDEGEV